MEQKDVVLLENMLSRVIDTKLEHVKEDFSHQVTMQAELTQNKLDLIVEGQQIQVEWMDRFEGRMDKIEHRLDGVEVKIVAMDKKFDGIDKKLDGVAADLSAHRKDTEVHRSYGVRED